MASITHSPQRNRLMKAVERAFDKAGWDVEKRSAESCDFLVEAHTLNFPIKCLDDSRIDYDSAIAIVTTLERYTRELRSTCNRQLIVILDRNFLGIPLKSLLDRDVFAITLEEISFITVLAAWSGGIPPAATDPSQKYLLERSIGHAVSVSRRYRDQGDIEAAIAWGQTALRNSIGFTAAHMHLFGLLSAAGEFDAAAKVGQEVCRYRPDDPQILRGMADLARRRGDKAEAARWTVRLIKQPTTPRTLYDILAKQRQQSGQPVSQRPVVPREDVAPLKSVIARLFRGLLHRAFRQNK
jgi:hypothetical protein